MFRQLKFIDGTSDKFWQIETSGDSHTVTFGKNGTNGQSKTKKFDSEETCLKDAEKLIAEKIKKGYSDNGLGEKVAANSSAKKATGEKADKEIIIAEYNEMVSKSDIRALVPFLEKYLKGNSELIKKEIKKAKRYWLTWTDLRNEAGAWGRRGSSWGMRGSDAQKKLINLSAVAAFSLSDTVTWTDIIQYINTPNDPDVMEVLNWAKPDWLAEYVAAQMKKNEWTFVDYEHIRALESRGLFSFHPEVYAKAISEYNDWRAGKNNGVMHRITYITTDPVAYERDVPLVFQYETGLQNNYISYNYQQPAENKLLWDAIFEKLLEDNKTDRGFLIRHMLEVQTKNWNNNLKSYFRKVLTKLNLTTEELIHHQESVFPLLHAEQSAIVNYALDILRPVLDHTDLQLEEFLNWVEPVFMRSDLKNGLKSLMIQFDKMSRTDTALCPRFSHLVADAFMVPDLQIQERAAKFLEKYGDKNDVSLREKLAMYAPQMMGDNRTMLKSFLEEAGDDVVDQLLKDALTAAEAYEYDPSASEKLTEEQKIHYPESWNDILFQVGNVIGNKEPIDMEMLMYTWLCKRDLFPADYKQQLEPYIKQLKSGYTESSVYNLFKNMFLNIHFRPGTVHGNKENYYERFRYMSIFNQMLVRFQELLNSAGSLPMLCTPTHAPCWVHPEALTERILAYEQAGAKIDPLDMSVAISRMHREQVEKAILLAEKIQQKQVKDILLFALGATDALSLKKSSWFQALLHNKEEVLWKGAWAMAARTHFPEGRFDAIDSSLQAIPFAREPFRPEFGMKPYYCEQWNYQSRKKEKVFGGNRLTINLPPFQNIPQTFIYATGLFDTGQENHYYYYTTSENDISFCCSLVPQNPESLGLLLTKMFYTSTEDSSKAAEGMLRFMLRDFVLFSPGMNIFLAATLFSKSKTTRALGGEVMIQAINDNRLPVTETGTLIGKLITEEYGPNNRVAEVLVSLKDLSYKHNDALLQLLDAMMTAVHLKDKLPTHFKKFMELYYDLAVKLNKVPATALSSRLDTFEKFGALKPIVTKLKKMK